MAKMNWRLWVSLVVLLMAMRTAHAGLVVGVFDESRAGSNNIITGGVADEAVALMVANFPGTTLAGTSELSPEFLAGVDILIVTPATFISASEQAALLGYITGGGRALLMGDGYGSYLNASITYFSPLGVTFSREPTGNLIVAETIAATHPLTDGPFGLVTEVLIRTSGELTDLGPYAHSLIEISATHEPIFAAIEEGAIGPSSGRVVMIADGNAFLDDDVGGFFAAEAHQSLFLNSISFLAVPEPSTLTLVGIACVVGGTIAAGRRVSSRK